MADKNDTYYCTWKRERDGTCTGWEIRRPKLIATASAPLDLMDTLGQIISKYYNDHEAALHFDPRLSEAGDPAWFKDGFVEIAWNADFKFRPSAATAYADGRCSRCGGGLGPRTLTLLEVDAISDRADGASSPGSNSPPPNDTMPGRLTIVSDDFLNSLTPEERSTFDVRPVKWSHPQRRQFFELVPRMYVPLGAIKGLEASGWQCNQCQRRNFGNGAVLGWCVEVACRQHLPKESPNFFFAGSDWDVHLYCTLERWRRFRGKRWAKKLTGQPLAVVDIALFDTGPLLGTLDEIAEFRRVHGFKVPFKPQPRVYHDSASLHRPFDRRVPGLAVPA